MLGEVGGDQSFEDEFISRFPYLLFHLISEGKERVIDYQVSKVRKEPATKNFFVAVTRGETAERR